MLQSGGRLGPYEVYRARDTKLDRPVALKILPVSFARDPDRLMRFEALGDLPLGYESI